MNNIAGVTVKHRRQALAAFKRAVMDKKLDYIEIETQFSEPDYLGGGPFRQPILSVPRRQWITFTLRGWTKAQKRKAKP